MNPLIYLEISTSTNFDIQRFASPDTQFVALYTANQTQGKGQYNNTWEMPAHQNLAISFLINSRDFRGSETVLNFHTATIIREFIANLTQQKTEIKWPNDIIINKKKIGGLLIEKKKIQNEEVLIIGFGLNVLQADFGNLPHAGSLWTQTGKSFVIKDVAEGLFNHLQNRIFEPENVFENFNRHLFGKDKISVFSLQGNRQNGIIKHADEKGYIWIDLEHDGLRKFFHKEIELLY